MLTSPLLKPLEKPLDDRLLGSVGQQIAHTWPGTSAVIRLCSPHEHTHILVAGEFRCQRVDLTYDGGRRHLLERAEAAEPVEILGACLFVPGDRAIRRHEGLGECAGNAHRE